MRLTLEKLRILLDMADPLPKNKLHVISIFITSLLFIPPISAEQWVPVGNLDIPHAGETCLTSGNDGIPYLITETAGVMKFDGSQWIDISKPEGTTNLYVETLTVGDDGTPYVLYGNDPYFVDKFENSQWVNIGGDLKVPSGIEDLPGGFNLAIASNNTPYVAYTDRVSAPERIVLTKFNGTEWVNVSEIVEEEHDLSLETGGLALASDDTPYIAYADPNYANQLTVVKFDGQQWVVVGQPGFSSDPIGLVELTLTDNDVPYVNYTSTTNFKNTVMKFDGNQWITIGNADFVDAYGISRLDLEVASNGVPYVAFGDQDSKKAKVMKFNGSEWVMVGDSVSAGEAAYTCLTLVNGTTPYVSYRDEEDSYRAVVKKLELNTQPPVLGNFTFGQADWYVQSDSPAPFVSNSSWGYVGFEILSNSPEIHYLNIIANANTGTPDGWIVRNFPILPGYPPLQSMDFNITLLGLAEGKELTSIAFCYALSSEMVEDEAKPPCAALINGLIIENIRERRKFLSSGLGSADKLVDNVDIGVGEPFGIQIYQNQGIKEISSRHELPSVSEEDMECLPGAFARSISWLFKEHLKINKDEQKIYKDLVKIAGFYEVDENGNYKERENEKGEKEKIPKGYDLEDGEKTGDDARIRLKGGYLKQLVKEATNSKKSAVTKRWNSQKDPDLCTWMLKEMKTEDVELAWEWSIEKQNEETGENEEEIKGHIVAVSQVIKNSDGSCTIKYRDDSGDSKGEGQGDGIEDDGNDRTGTLSKNGKFEGEGIKVGIVTSGVSESLPIIVDFFKTISQDGNRKVIWKTGSEQNNGGFHIWRGIKNNASNYEVTPLKELGYSEQVNPELNENCSTQIQGQLEVDNSNQPPKLISAVGNSAESTCYSFTDTSNLSDGTYYYLLEDIDDNGKSTFHCDHIDAVTVGQGTVIDLPSAINYCEEVTGSED